MCTANQSSDNIHEVKNMKKVILFLFVALWVPFTAAQDLDYGEGGFIANFDIDSAHTTDGTNYKISATGKPILLPRP
jgi:hypothetical protein